MSEEEVLTKAASDLETKTTEEEQVDYSDLRVPELKKL